MLWHGMVGRLSAGDHFDRESVEVRSTDGRRLVADAAHRTPPIPTETDANSITNLAFRFPPVGRRDTYASTSVDHNLQNVKFDRQECRIKEFASFEDDWDGDGAKRIPMEAIYAALKFLTDLRQRFPGKDPTGIAPSPDGEVFFYWMNRAGYAEINFEGDGNISLCWEDEDGETQIMESRRDEIPKLDQDPIWKFLSDFLGGF